MASDPRQRHPLRRRDDALARLRLDREYRRALPGCDEVRSTAVADAAPVAIVTVGPDERILSWNRRARALLGFEPSAVIGRTPAATFLPKREGHAVDVQGLLATAQHEAAGPPVQTVATTTDGISIPVDLSVASMDDGTFVLYLTDVTRRTIVEDRLRDLADEAERRAAIDGLTGLFNRRHFEQAIAARQASRYAVLCVDIHALPMLNEVHGHDATDHVIASVGLAVRQVARMGDLLARYSADTFACLLFGADTTEAADVAGRMRQAMYAVTAPFGAVRINIGAAAAASGVDAREAWRAAQEALNTAKADGPDHQSIVDIRGPAHNHVARRAQPGLSDAEDLLLNSLQPLSMVAVYQPIVDIHTGAVAGYEALARPVGKPSTMSVEAMFAAAHRMGMARDLDWICRRAAVAGVPALHAGAQPLFINVGVASLLDPVHDVDQMLLLLQWAELTPERVVLEITERERILDIDRLRVVLAAYRSEGFRFAVDDLGEGHLTLRDLGVAAPEFLKLSRSLCVDAVQTGNHALIRSVVAFAQDTNARVIAEGLEVADDVVMLRSLGVELGQGYGLVPPTPPAELHRVLATPSLGRAADLSLSIHCATLSRQALTPPHS